MRVRELMVLLGEQDPDARVLINPRGSGYDFSYPSRVMTPHDIFVVKRKALPDFDNLQIQAGTVVIRCFT